MTPIVRSGGAVRTGAVLLFIGPLVSWAAELITASAWQEPHYSPFYNWVSHLGLTGPSQVAFGQVGNSPLGAVMDTGWVLYGILLIAGTLLTLDLRGGARPIAIVALAILAGAGVSLIGIFQGSNANVANGLIAFHTYGAQGVMLAGNVMAIVVGVNASRIGLGHGRRVASIVLGVFGLVAFGVFMADVFTGWAWNIGLFERAVIYPIMIGHVVLGRGLVAALRPGADLPKPGPTRSEPTRVRRSDRTAQSV
ncbi:MULTISPECIES: DUF998 domain-containing protein [Amycolatopsis]|uniref:DUF998 domain-containing protein n=1 Tax=Amycolatopsis bullii TaxID=941987 RepID=A0ABQ3KB45_9PSEU|nr:DUF998 domain-containing protein [Amycolatopsis bullii]GHG03073.1 hypothetical protein GCM10017567_18140 [Amycolatopsis bullii]